MRRTSRYPRGGRRNPRRLGPWTRSRRNPSAEEEAKAAKRYVEALAYIDLDLGQRSYALKRAQSILQGFPEFAKRYGTPAMAVSGIADWRGHWTEVGLDPEDMPGVEAEEDTWEPPPPPPPPEPEPEPAGPTGPRGGTSLSYEKAAKLYPKFRFSADPARNSNANERRNARDMAERLLRTYPVLAEQFGKLAADPEVDKLRREAPRAKPPKPPKTPKPEPPPKPPKPPKPPPKAKWSRRRPEGWTEEDEIRQANAWRAANSAAAKAAARAAAREARAAGKKAAPARAMSARAPEDVAAASAGGLMLWTGPDCTIFYVYGKPRVIVPTYAQAESAMRDWIAEKRKRSQLAIYAATGPGKPRKIKEAGR